MSQETKKAAIVDSLSSVQYNNAHEQADTYEYLFTMSTSITASHPSLKVIIETKKRKQGILTNVIALYLKPKPKI